MLIALGGDERDSVLERRAALRSEVLSESNPSFHHIKLSGTEADVPRLLNEVQSFPLLPGRRLIEVSEAEKLQGDIARLCELKSNESDDVLLLVFNKWDGRKKTEKLLKKTGVAEVFVRPKEHEMEQVIRARLRNCTFDISPDALEMLVSIVGVERGRLERIIERIELSGEQSVSAEVMETMFPGQTTFDLFRFARLVAVGKQQPVLNQLTQLESEHADPQAVLNIVLWQLRQLLTIKAEVSEGLSIGQALKKHRVFGDRQHSTRKAVERFSFEAHCKRLARMSEADKPIKMKIGSAWTWLTRYMIDICPY